MSEVYSAIANVVAQIGVVEKERPPGMNFDVLGADAIMAAARPLMIAESLVMYPTAVELIDCSPYSTRTGVTMNRAILRVTFRFVHVASNTSVDVVTFGEAADSGDKSIPKAMTLAWKYAVRQTFLIATGDDPDRHVVPPVGVKPVSRDIRDTEGGNGKESSSDSPAVQELISAIAGVKDPDAVTAAILKNRGLASLHEISDPDARELLPKVRLIEANEFFDDKIPGNKEQSNG